MMSSGGDGDDIPVAAMTVEEATAIVKEEQDRLMNVHRAHEVLATEREAEFNRENPFFIEKCLGGSVIGVVVFGIIAMLMPNPPVENMR